MRFAILVHAVGERTHAPVFGLGDLAAGLLDNAGHLGGQFLDLLGARILAREKNMLVERHDGPCLCWRGPGVKPFEAFGKDSWDSSEGGNTGRRADWPCHINIAWSGEIAETVRSVPGRDPRMARFIRILPSIASETGGFRWDSPADRQPGCRPS